MEDDAVAGADSQDVTENCFVVRANLVRSAGCGVRIDCRRVAGDPNPQDVKKKKACAVITRLLSAATEEWPAYGGGAGGAPSVALPMMSRVRRPIAASSSRRRSTNW